MKSSRCLTGLVAILTAVSLISCGNDDVMQVAVNRHKRLAGELSDNRLYHAAVEEYRKITEFETLDDKTLANVYYLIGRISYENLGDYQQAAACYLRARALDPNGSFVGEASRNLVAAMEKTGNRLDAKRQLEAMTDLGASGKVAGDVEVARIDADPIWLSQIDARIQTLPLQMQSRFGDLKEKKEFVRQYVGMELIYRAALRENYADDPLVKKQQEAFLRNLLIEKYAVDHIIPEIKIDTLDVRNYYLAQKEDRYNGKPFDSVMAQVFFDYQGEKQSAAFNEYIAELIKVEKVVFLDHNVK